jgi:hypothetical protein
MSKKKRKARKALSRKAFYRFEWKKIRNNLIQAMYDKILVEEVMRCTMKYYGDEDE